MRRREFIAGLGGAALVVYFNLGMLHESTRFDFDPDRADRIQNIVDLLAAGATYL